MPFLNSIPFSSPELKAQVSFSDRLSSVVCLSVRLSVRPSVSVNFSYFRFLLMNHWTNFNQTCHKAVLGEGDSSLFKWRAPPFSKGRYLWYSENTLMKFKNLFSRTTGPISTKLGTKHYWVKGTQGFVNKDQSILKKEIIYFSFHYQHYDIIAPIKWAMWPICLLFQW